MENSDTWLKNFRAGQVIPAVPLALTEAGRFSERHERALIRYYRAAGAGGLAVGVHSTQFEIHDDSIGLYRPVLELVMETAKEKLDPPLTMIAGVCGRTAQASREATLARSLGYHAILVSLGAFSNDEESVMIDHLRELSTIMPVIGFYLQESVGGRYLSRGFWSEVAMIEKVIGIKIAPFNRYRTLDVVAGVEASGRDDIALYTGNDDNIIPDLVIPLGFRYGKPIFIRGGLLGQWGVWTKRARELFDRISRERDEDGVSLDLLANHVALTDANAAIFDVNNHFRGVLPGIHYLLYRVGLLPSTRCIDPSVSLSPGQKEAIDDVRLRFPFLCDDDFVRLHLPSWLSN